MFFSEVTELVASLRQRPTDKDEALAIFVGEESAFEVNTLINGLHAEGIRFFGGIFPGLIWRNTKREKGFVVKIVPGFQRLYITRDLSAENTLQDLSKAQKYKSALILVDGIASGISGFLSNLFALYGDSTYLGGGAGFSDLNQRNCLFFNDGFFKGGAVVAFFDRPVSLAVKHGWRKFNGPYVVTRSSGNVIREINWEDAFAFYRRILKYSGEEITPENFFAVARKYPFGLYKKGHEDIVRDPIKTDGSSIVCVGEVPENALVYFLKGSKEALVTSARQVAKNSINDIKSPTDCIIFDCISRALYLEDSFGEELDAIDKALAPLTAEGVLTLGEISSSGYGGVSFLNKTVVVGVF